jgi:hypothetical protein
MARFVGRADSFQGDPAFLIMIQTDYDPLSLVRTQDIPVDIKCAPTQDSTFSRP